MLLTSLTQKTKTCLINGKSNMFCEPQAKTVYLIFSYRSNSKSSQASRCAGMIKKKLFFLYLLYNHIETNQSHLHCTIGITPTRVTSGGAHLRGLAPGLHNLEATSQRWRAVGDTVSDLIGLGKKPRTSQVKSNFYHSATPSCSALNDFYFTS